MPLGGMAACIVIVASEEEYDDDIAHAQEDTECEARDVPGGASVLGNKRPAQASGEGEEHEDSGPSDKDGGCGKGDRDDHVQQAEHNAVHDGCIERDWPGKARRQSSTMC
jgi:hypothetical protein